MRGVAYQQDVTGGNSSSTETYSDPLADASGCKRDIPYLQQLRTNTIRVYAIDPTADHSECMQLLQDAGIYVVSDLSQPSQSINRDDAAWNDELYARYTSVVDALANYTNVLGFFAGNEVSNAANNTDASAFVKAAVRDTKAYIKAKDYRTIGVGYATNDDADIRVNMADYFNCGDDAANSIDFWGYNIYSWCGDSSYSESGYDVRTTEFSNYSVPVFFAEYGCNTPSPRVFTEVETLFGDEMADVWSGGIVYMYFQEANDYGLVSVSGNSVSTLADFSNLSKRIATVSPTGTNSASYSPTLSAQACPTVGDDWRAEASPLPPSPNQELCSCMYNSLTCVAASSVDTDSIGDLFSTVCGLSDTACAGIAHNATTGTFGAYSMCNSTEQLAYVLNAYYNEQSSSNKASACDFKGSATTKSSHSATGQCSSLMAEAGTAGTGTVTSSPTATGAGAGSSGSSGTKASGSASSSGAASGVAIPAFNFGLVGLGAYVSVAALSGAAMLLL